MEALFDEAWRRRALRGDADATSRLVDAALVPLYRFCFYRVGRDKHLAEEVVQESLLRAIRGLERYDPRRSGGDVFPWLCGLARNEIQRVLARERSAESLQRMWQRMDDQLRQVYAGLESDPLAGEILRREETREMVGATMSQLPTQYRRALEAKYVAGQSVREIAAALSMTEKAVESQLSRARRAFRETFLTLTRNLNFDAS